jgi:hypothetical protein
MTEASAAACVRLRESAQTLKARNAPGTPTLDVARRRDRIGGALEAPDLFVPFALTDDGRLYRPEEASKGHFQCPGCQTPVHLRRKSRRACAHFAHTPDVHCPDEFRVHAIAIGLVMQVTNDWIAGAPPPDVDIHCTGCTRAMPWQPTGAPAGCIAERRLDDRNRLPDVTILDSAKASLLLVEVRYSNAVDERRASDLTEGHAWIEVSAEAIIESPRRWAAEQSQGFRPEPVCSQCAERHRAEDAARRLALEVQRQAKEEVLAELRTQKRRAVASKRAKQRAVQETLAVGGWKTHR